MHNTFLNKFILRVVSFLIDPVHVNNVYYEYLCTKY